MYIATWMECFTSQIQVPYIELLISHFFQKPGFDDACKTVLGYTMKHKWQRLDNK